MKKILKNLSSIIIIIIISIIAMIFISLFIASEVNRSRLYPAVMVVEKIDEIKDTITFMDGNGSFWQYEGVEDFQEGDICSMIMDDKGTPEIKDDEIVQLKYDILP